MVPTILELCLMHKSTKPTSDQTIIIPAITGWKTWNDIQVIALNFYKNYK